MTTDNPTSFRYIATLTERDEWGQEHVSEFDGELIFRSRDGMQMILDDAFEVIRNEIHYTSKTDNREVTRLSIKRKP